MLKELINNVSSKGRLKQIEKIDYNISKTHKLVNVSIYNDDIYRIGFK